MNRADVDRRLKRLSELLGQKFFSEAGRTMSDNRRLRIYAENPGPSWGRENVFGREVTIDQSVMFLDGAIWALERKR